MNYHKQLKIGGPIYLCAGLFLLMMDMLNRYVIYEEIKYWYFDVVIIGNLIISCSTTALGILLTSFAHMKADKLKPMLAWAIMAVILWAYQICQTLYIMVDYTKQYGWWMPNFFWRKYCMQSGAKSFELQSTISSHFSLNMHRSDL